MTQIVLTSPVLKADENGEHRLVYGWASVIEAGGQPVVDAQGDVIDEPTLLAAAHRFATEARTGKLMHEGRAVGTVVESVVLTRALQRALNVNLNQTGWLIAYRVEDDTLWERVKRGEFPAFSIGGRGRRETMR